ncbi:MAG: alpha/beta hydrolase [Pseudomonadota bacterium]
MTFTHRTIETNGQRLHVAEAGPEGAPVMLFLHGFPEYWTAWADVAAHFTDTHRVVLPDQRGINRSSKPPNVADYDAKFLVGDMIGLLDEVAPNERVILCGHDWGASVAYALAMRHGQRLSHFVVANGVHPICFQKALLGDRAQLLASQYMLLLRREDAFSHMSADKFAKTFRMFEKFSSAPWLTDEKKNDFREAWRHEDAMRTMLHWYSSSPMDVPAPDAPLRTLEISEAMQAKYAITTPHLLLWGMDDTALLPVSRADLPLFCDDLTVEEIDGASHWILHEKPKLVADRIRRFIGS